MEPRKYHKFTIRVSEDIMQAARKAAEETRIPLAVICSRALELFAATKVFPQLSQEEKDTLKGMMEDAQNAPEKKPRAPAEPVFDATLAAESQGFPASMPINILPKDYRLDFGMGISYFIDGEGRLYTDESMPCGVLPPTWEKMTPKEILKNAGLLD